MARRRRSRCVFPSVSVRSNQSAVRCDPDDVVLLRFCLAPITAQSSRHAQMPPIRQSCSAVVTPNDPWAAAAAWQAYPDATQSNRPTLQSTNTNPLPCQRQFTVPQQHTRPAQHSSTLVGEAYTCPQAVDAALHA